MKAIEGNLDMSKNYKLDSVIHSQLYGNDGCDFSGETCDNCGTVISNVAVVERDDGLKYRIGLDCMATIINMSPNAVKQAKNQLRRESKFVKFLTSDAKSIIVGKYIAWIYDHVVTEWSVKFAYRVPLNKYDHLINKMNLVTIISDD